MDFAEYESREFVRALDMIRPWFHTRAICRGKGVENFFPGRGKSSLIKQAVETCNYCPVQLECHNYAMKHEIESGVWGGSTPEQRTSWIQQKVTAEEAWEKLTLE